MKMWTAQNLHLCMALSFVTSAAGVIHVYGYAGREANVSCPYGEGFKSHEKYLCRNNCHFDDVLIKTSEEAKSKYSIRDDKSQRRFTATISDLSSTDAGKYWCGVTTTGKDIYTEVKLEVRPDSCCQTSSKVQSYDGGSASISCTFEPENQNRLKYICRGTQPSTCLQQALITSDRQQNGRFKLDVDNNLRKFTVTINSLTQEDSGSYLCGVRRNTGLDVFTAAELEVKEWCCVTSSNLKGFVGRPLTMQCPYPPQHKDNRKFLCKGDHRKTCTDMVTSRSRFTLQDDVSLSSFTVTITELKEGDAGTYWCGSDSQWRVGNYTKIHLTVDEIMERAINITDDAVAPIHILIYILPATGGALMILTVALVVSCKCKCCEGQGAGVNLNTNAFETAEAEEQSIDHIYENNDGNHTKHHSWLASSK